VLKLDPESENFDEKILEIDKQIITRIDETAKEQQSTLICAGVPGFQSSNDATEISFQMAVIKFILSLESVYSSY
jgi:hypothetical protein